MIITNILYPLLFIQNCTKPSCNLDNYQIWLQLKLLLTAVIKCHFNVKNKNKSYRKKVKQYKILSE